VEDSAPYDQRVTGSFTDQFDYGEGQFGVAIGAQIRRDFAPEDIYATSSTWRPCNTIEGVDRSNDCGYLVNASGAPTGASPVYFTSNQYIFRAMDTESDRDAVMANFQWQPNSSFDINLDLQYSNRSDTEARQNLIIADGRRDIAPIEISPTGALLAWRGESRLETNPVYRVRDEAYLGGGLSVEWAGENLTLTADAGYSRTDRDQDELDMRIQTNARVFYTIDTRGFDVPSLTLTNTAPVSTNTGRPFNLDDHLIYTASQRARRRLEIVDDEIKSLRLDADYEWGGKFISSIEAGLRFAERDRQHDDSIDTTLSLAANAFTSANANTTRLASFPVSNLFEGATTPTQGLTWAAWDPQRLFAALAGSPSAGLPVGSTLTPDDSDVFEQTAALYAQANFETQLFGLPAYGNFGVRAVQTKIESTGISSELATSPGTVPGTIVVRPTGVVTENVEENDFVNVLPSANIVFELRDDMLLRFGAYKAIARPDMEAMTAALAFDAEADLADIGSIVSASGNPMIEPLEALNLDASWEWYINDETAFSVAAYAKELQTGFETVTENLTLIVDGSPQSLTIGRTSNSSDSSMLTGIEMSAQHMFTGLPEPLNGLGFQAGLNLANSDFEFEDPTVPDGVNPLRNFTQPANIPGYSEATGNLTVFWEGENASLRVAYKARSEYFKPFRQDANRFVGTQDFIDVSASYDISKRVQLRASALNLTDEPNLMYRPTPDSLAEANFSGRRFYIGLRARF
jgi:iron complex outermembrane recepter protein